MATATAPRAARRAPGPRAANPMIGVYFEAQRDPLAFTMAMRRQYGDIVRMRTIMGIVSYQFSHPDDIDYILRRNTKTYPKGIFVNSVKPVLGDGILTLEGDSWLRQRRLAQPAFHRARLMGFGEIMARRAGELIERWRPAAAAGSPVDVTHEMMRVTIEIVGEALFSANVSDSVDRIDRPFAVLRDHVMYRFYHPLALPERVPTGRNRRFMASKRELDEIVYEIIRQRRAGQGQGAGDLLAMLMDARDEDTGEMMNDLQLRDEVTTLLLAGHETTAVALSWACHLLAEHPEIQARLQAEVDQVLGGRAPTLDDLPQLPYARMVIDETMRLYPPVYGLVRQAAQDDEIRGYRVSKRAIISIVPYVTHRHPEFWDQPEVFDPERFSPERSAGRPAFAYFPFGGGPRMCMGNHFALMEAQLILALIAQRYALRSLPGHPIEPEPSITLRPRHGIKLLLAARD
ncbi:MAG TPA: cytochrome P450 [Herpetosiphonaceae bacterium]